MEFEVRKESSGKKVYVKPSQPDGLLTGIGKAGIVMAKQAKFTISSRLVADIERKLAIGQPVVDEYFISSEEKPGLYSLKQRRPLLRISGKSILTGQVQTLHLISDEGYFLGETPPFEAEFIQMNAVQSKGMTPDPIE